ncbi:MAG: hypothetical protein C4519_13230 [Desulfobacteraceae bacterium]|nr:MAG: hypothetical protein C4519_13230 [Desulfobacteraceae bacterium]
MKSVPKTLIGFLSMLLAGWIMSAAAAEPNLNTSSGRISAINLNADTVVVEVPIAEDKNYTVGGPVVGDATLKKNGQTADLSDFEVGEWVQVTWEKTAQTHLIKELASK